MALIEYQLDKKINKVENALKIIRLGALSTEPLYVCYSGGKDSKCYVEDGRPITRAPQSWQYVEEI